VYYKYPTKRIGLIQSKRHHLTCSGQGKTITYVSLNNNQSLTILHCCYSVK